MTYADLELSLRRSSDDASDDSYTVELQFQVAASPAAPQSIVGPLPRVRFAADELLESSQDPATYGERLSRMLFADPRLRVAFAQARAQVKDLDIPLRLRLRLDVADDAIHRLLWETLQDPDRGDLLCASERLLISRYLDCGIRPHVRARPRAALKAVVAIASPVGLDEYRLPRIDVASEVERCRAALGDLPTTIVAQGYGERATLQNLTAALRDGPDILYLVCHGTLREGHPYLWLEREDGTIGRVAGEAFITALERLEQRPSLIVLASCQSAGRPDAVGALAALGPRLANAGLLAVVAMQGDITMETVAALMPTFFHELRRDGCIDRALAAARARVLDRHDWWMPALFMRVRDGMLWSEPEFLAPPEPECPPKLVDFVGREAELDAFAKQLATEQLAVIIGMPGVGKSALAAMLAGRVASPDKIFWHTFHEHEGIDIIIWKLAGFLAIHGQENPWRMLNTARQTGDQSPPSEVLLDYLYQMVRGQGYLLCLDDVQWVENDPLLDQLVKRLRSNLLIIASRQIPPFLEKVESLPLGGLSNTETERLLTTRGLTLPDDLVADLYSQTDGNAQLLMLAIDALKRTAHPERLIARLVEADDIERYLLTEVDKRLTEDERVVMSGVAALLDHGGTRDAIEAVLDTSGIRRMLSDLGQRCLLIVAEGKAGKEYRQHAIVQAFYYGLLSKRERPALHRRAGEYYVSEERDVLKAARHFLLGAEDARAAALATSDVMALINIGQGRPLAQVLEQLTQRHEAVEASSATHLDPQLWAAVQVARGRVYHYIGEAMLAKQASEAAFAYLAALPASAAVRRLQALVCIDMGRWLRNESPKAALTWLDQGLKAVADGDFAEQTAEIYNLIGTARIALGNYAAAAQAIAHGLDVLPANAVQLRVGVLINQGLISFHQGDFEQAQGAWEQALALNEQIHDTFRMVTILGNLGSLRDTSGDWARAALDYRKALVEAERLGIHVQRVRLGLNLGLLLTNQGNDQQALDQLSGSLVLAREHSFSEHEIGCISGLIDLHLRRREVDPATPLLDEAEQMVQETAFSYRRTEIYRRRAEAHLLRGETEMALKCAQEALQLDQTAGEHYDEGLDLRIKGQGLRAAGQVEAALAAFERSAELLKDDPYEAARTKVQHGRALIENGHAKRGASSLHEARETFQGLGARRDFAEVAAIIEATGEDAL